MTETDIVRRIRLSLKSAKFALDEAQFDAAINAIERLLANNLEPIIAHFKPITMSASDNAQYEKVVKEKYDAIAELTLLKQKIAQYEHDQHMVERFARNYRSLTQILEFVLVNPEILGTSAPVIKEPIHVKEIEKSKVLRFRLDQLTKLQVYSLEEMKVKLDEILKDVRYQPSPELASVLNTQDLDEIFPRLPYNIQKEGNLLALPPEIYTSCREVFGNIKDGGHSRSHVVMVFLAMLNNLPFDISIDNRRYETLRRKVGKVWLTKPADNWAIVSIRTGNLQKNLHRLSEIGWK